MKRDRSWPWELGSVAESRGQWKSVSARNSSISPDDAQISSAVRKPDGVYTVSRAVASDRRDPSSRLEDAFLYLMTS